MNRNLDVFKEQIIKPHDYLLNSLLDSSLYVVDKKQLNHFASRYFRHKNMSKVKKPYEFIHKNKNEFITFVRTNIFNQKGWIKKD